MSVVRAEPLPALVAANLTWNGPRTLSPGWGVQVSRPDLLSGAGAKAASFAGGSSERSASSTKIWAPSGSEAVTSTVIGVCSRPPVTIGAVTTGGRSVLFTEITTLAVAVNASLAVKVTT